MRISFLLILLPLMACHNKDNSSNKEVLTELAVKNEWLNQEESFEKNEDNSNKEDNQYDSAKELVFVSDLNNDEIKDSIWRYFKAGNQHFVFSFSNIPLIISGQRPFKFFNSGDLNHDNWNEIVLVEEIPEGCWAELQVYSFKKEWLLKLKTITSLCAGDFYFKSETIDKRNAIFTSFGFVKDSIQNNDTIEIVDPNSPVRHTITW
jgi:hypothetical protein